MEVSKIQPLDQDWIDKVSREDETGCPPLSAVTDGPGGENTHEGYRLPEKWDPLEGIGDEHNDKSQDTDWLRRGFLARGAEIDIMQQRIYKLLAAYSANEIAVEGYQRACFWYRAALATAIGVSILRWFT